MIYWLGFLLLSYVLFLGFSAARSRYVSGGDQNDMAFASNGVSTTLLLLSFSATLFSTFTLLGVPDFFRNHGVGTWLFIGVTDVTMGFVVLWFGMRYKKFLKLESVSSMTQFLTARYRSKIAPLVYMAGIFVFLAPYVAIQIQGVSIFFDALSPAGVPIWFWSLIILSSILLYSLIGGFRAIVYSDVVQGLILLVVIYVIAGAVLNDVGGIRQMFEGVRVENAALLETPGPKGLMNWQYLVASFIAIIWMPITQPQLTSRIAAIKHEREIPIMAIGISLFAFLVLLPTIAIGLGGSLLYPGSSTGEFLGSVLVGDRGSFISALAIVGLLAAAMSTADSQIFSLSSEVQSGTKIISPKNKVISHRSIFLIFAVVCFVLSLLATSEIVALARVSFAGTAILGPMIVLAIASDNKPSKLTPYVAAVCLILFLTSSFGFLPKNFEGLRLDLGLFMATTLVAILEWLIIRNKET